MLENLKQNIQELKKCTGISIVIDSDGSFIMNSITLSNNKGKVLKEKTTHLTKSIAKLTINKDIPVSIVLNGKGVLVKRVDKLLNSVNPLESVLPQANPADFYIQSREHNGFHIVAIVRRTIADNLIEALYNEGFTVLNIYLGLSVIETILPFINAQEKDILAFDQCIVTHDGHSITGFNTGTAVQALTEYVLAGQYIQNTHLLSYAAALSTMAEPLSATDETGIEQLNRNRINYLYKKYFNSAAIAFIALVFLLLLINFFVYDHYYSINSELVQFQGIAKQQMQETQGLNGKVRQKERFILRYGWDKPVKTSYFADRFASLLPEGIWFTSLQFYPARSSVDVNTDEFQFRKDTIELAGACTDASLINTFINNIKMLKEINDVSIKAYSYKKEEDEGQFLLEIITK